MANYNLPKGITYTIAGVPKIFHQIWIGSDVPDAIKPFMATFRKMEGYKYKVWKNKDLTEKNFPITWKYIQKILKGKAIKYAMIADLMRLEILYHVGGIYVDTTLIALKNFDDILEVRSKFIMSNEKDCALKCRNSKGQLYISNSFIASIPKYKVLARLLDENKLRYIDFSLPANYATGPYYVRTGIKRNDDVKMLPTNFIYPENEIDKCVFETRVQKGLKKKIYLGKVFYIRIPCSTREYPGSYAVKTWMIGGTWIIH
jgi:mannosyltransferase OCH1-like enzyme